MTVAAAAMVGLVAVVHVYFLVLEMFLWKRPFGRKTFAMSAEQAEQTAVLAGNQGLYNGFLAAGLAWGLWQGVLEGRAILTFFLGCVIIAGLYGGLTAKRVILFFQMVPGLIALALVWLA